MEVLVTLAVTVSAVEYRWVKARSEQRAQVPGEARECWYHHRYTCFVDCIAALYNQHVIVGLV